MKQVKVFGLIITTAVIMASCGGGSKKEGDAALNDKKAQLEKLKGENDKNNEQIAKLQDEVSKLDTSNANPAKIKLVAITPVALQNFAHYIELQGKIDAENISYIAPRGPQGGLVKAIFVKQGDNVKKGQLLLKLDDAVQRQQVIATSQSVGGLKTQLALEKTIYDRRNNLWQQGIGTQVDLLSQKAKVDGIENQIAVANQNIKLSQEQLNLTNVYSDVDGVADIVNIRVGETFTGVTAAGPQIKIVNTSSLKAISNIPENYLGSVSKGTPVVIVLPDLNKSINSSVSFIGSSIDALTRGFVVEARLAHDASLKPNQIALMKIKDYNADNAIAIPLKTLQNDEKGKFVMVASTENGKLVARKRTVNIGMLNGDILEIKTGLKAGDALITEGYAGLYEGQQLKTAGSK